jgi:hypothetical protein
VSIHLFRHPLLRLTIFNHECFSPWLMRSIERMDSDECLMFAGDVCCHPIELASGYLSRSKMVTRKPGGTQKNHNVESAWKHVPPASSRGVRPKSQPAKAETPGEKVLDKLQTRLCTVPSGQLRCMKSGSRSFRKTSLRGCVAEGAPSQKTTERSRTEGPNGKIAWGGLDNVRDRSLTFRGRCG